MILGKLALNEAQVMSFGINVFGTTQAPTDIRFVIEGDEFDIVCRCKQIGEDLQVDIPKLKGILESKEYPTRLEVIIDDKIFTPMRESIEFNPLVEFDVQKKNSKMKNEGVEITVKATSSAVKKNTLQENIDKVKGEFEVREVNGFNVLTKDEKYWGFVSESSIIKSEVGYTSLSELVDSLTSKDVA